MTADEEATTADRPGTRSPSVAGLAGAAGMILFLPPLVYYAWICVVHYQGALVLPTTAEWSHVQAPTLTSVAILAGWFGFHALCQVYLPGRWRQGAELDDGT